MSKDELRWEYIRLSSLHSIGDSIDLADIFLEHFWNVITIHHYDKVYSYANKDAMIMNQMMFTKLTHLKKIIEGVGYQAKDGGILNDIIDPTIVASLTRNVFEAVSLFNLIFRSTKSNDEKAIIYGLWVISGLQYRQRFALSSIENKKKHYNEKIQIESIVNEITNTELYKSLDKKNQTKVDNKIKSKDYKIMFDDKEVIFLTWQDMTDVMRLDKGIFDNIYAYLSFYSHPSHVSVMQFEQMFSKEKEAFKSLTAMNLKYCFSLLSVFVADYINLFPQVKDTFERLSTIKQIVVDSSNRLLRGEEFSINDAWKNLN